MDLEWLPTEAKPSDSHEIASLFAQSWTSPFTQLQFGPLEPHILAKTMAPRISRQMGMPNVRFDVIRHPTTQTIVSVAQWTLPSSEEQQQQQGEEDEEGTAASPHQETQEQNNEHQLFEDESYVNTLPDECNKSLILAFTIGLRNLRQQVLQNQKKYYSLENLATHSDFRGKGLARRLIEQVLAQADDKNDDVLVYLETASDNLTAMGLYKSLGFEERGRYRIEDLREFVGREELERCGGVTEHTHVAFVRYPKVL
ncbi:hypothetical protein N0V83_004392 [Neocucurbitaria cava]|uniref:N-acetyltransferase domain-containing protein n=1 Tax=Neocucurbitaria cava TaxID=798079 RepID=A0A9W9CMZ0_9PLEO|nr:hypothetical protein N0V83_004392 [Neocucurbitaria cava]